MGALRRTGRLDGRPHHPEAGRTRPVEPALASAGIALPLRWGAASTVGAALRPKTPGHRQRRSNSRISADECAGCQNIRTSFERETANVAVEFAGGSATAVENAAAEGGAADKGSCQPGSPAVPDLIGRAAAEDLQRGRPLGWVPGRGHTGADAAVRAQKLRRSVSPTRSRCVPRSTAAAR
ncbi:predicted protein [Streptomyces sp. AA4]|nr:predicted protein [Streptomyces sp. AA4]